MSTRPQSYGFVAASGNYVLHLTRGQKSRRIEISRLALVGVCALFGTSAIIIVAAAGYLMFRDDMLAGLLDREDPDAIRL